MVFPTQILITLLITLPLIMKGQNRHSIGIGAEGLSDEFIGAKTYYARYSYRKESKVFLTTSGNIGYTDNMSFGNGLNSFISIEPALKIGLKKKIISPNAGVSATYYMPISSSDFINESAIIFSPLIGLDLFVSKFELGIHIAPIAVSGQGIYWKTGITLMYVL
jgi:hypothetical protein